MATPAARTRAKWSGKLESSAVIGGGIANLWTELAIYPEQLQSSQRWGPEQFFAAALLSDAEHNLHNQKERHFVIEWMGQEWESPYPFAAVCAAVQLEPDYVRRVFLARSSGRKARALA